MGGAGRLVDRSVHIAPRAFMRQSSHPARKFPDPRSRRLKDDARSRSPSATAAEEEGGGRRTEAGRGRIDPSLQ